MFDKTVGEKKFGPNCGNRDPPRPSAVGSLWSHLEDRRKLLAWDAEYALDAEESNNAKYLLVPLETIEAAPDPPNHMYQIPETAA